MKFRKKPVVIDAFQLTIEIIKSHLFDGQPLPDGLRMGAAGYHKGTKKINHAHLYIDALEGEMKVNTGDWIITNDKGRHPCKPEIFEMTYEAVES